MNQPPPQRPMADDEKALTHLQHCGEGHVSLRPPDTLWARTLLASEYTADFLEVVVGGKVLEEVALLLHDAVELVDVDLTIAITVGLVDHVLELLIVDGLTELLSHAGEVAEGDLVGVVVVEELEHLLDVLAGVLLAHLGGHHLEELGELNGAVAVVGNHLLELLVLDLEAKGAHGGLELADVDH